KLSETNGIRPKKTLGHSCIIDLNLVDLTVRAAELNADDLALEVGSGTGSLTARLAEQAGAVLSVEMDRDFHALARDAVAGRYNVTLLQADILANKNHLNPDVLTELETLQKASGCGRLKLVANLPYAVAAPVLANFLLADFSF